MGIEMHEAANNESGACLVVFFKAPERSKRRLADEIGELATQAATRLWDCVIEDVESWRGGIVYAPAEVEDADWLGQQLTESHAAVLQHGVNLGARINHVDGILRNSGETRLIYVGTDCPAMAPDYLALAAELLGEVDVVLGPASDGGVVLMASRAPWPPLEALPWSTSALRVELASICRKAGRSLAELDPRDDVDTVDALLAAGKSLAADTRPARRALRNWLLEPGTAWSERS